MKELLPMSLPEIDESDVQAVVEVVRSGRLALGPKTLEFEREMASYVGTKHAIAVSSGTAALHLIVKSMGIGAWDEVLVPSFTFAASVNAILFEGAKPVFVDIEPGTCNLDPADLERRITPSTKAIMAVDVFGHPVDWKRILPIAQAHKLRIIDDACEALGAEYQGVRAGKFGDAATFAFYPNKQITTGEGGIIVTDNDDIARDCRSYRNQGRDEMGQWLHHARLGYNYRMDEMSAALGHSQLKRIESFVAKREKVAALYSKRLSQVKGVLTQVPQAHVRMSWFVYVVTLDDGLERDPVIAALADRGIPSRGYFAPIHSQPYLKNLGIRTEQPLPVTDRLSNRMLALPFHNNLTEKEIDQVGTALEAVLQGQLSSRGRKAA